MTADRLVSAGQFNQAARQIAYITIALALPRLGVPAGLIGEWESLVFLGYLLGFGWTTGLLQAFLVQMGALSGYRADRFGRRATLVFLVLSAAVLSLAAILHQPLFAVLQYADVPVGWYFFFILLLGRWPSYCFEQALLLTGKHRVLLVYAVVNALGLTLSLLLPLYYGYDLGGAMCFFGGYAGAKSLGIAAWALRGELSLLEPRSRREIGEWIRRGRPLMAYATVAASVTAVDPLLVNYWSGGDEATFAIFRYGVRELPFLAALITGMTAVTIPAISRDGVDGMAFLRQQSRRLFHYVFALALLLMVTADYWWVRVFTPTFAESLPVFRTFLLVVGCRLVFAMTVLTALNETRRLYLLGLLELIVNVIVSLVLAPTYGLLGIVWGTVIASYFHELCLIVYLRHRMGVGWKQYADYRWYALYLLALFLAYASSIH